MEVTQDEIDLLRDMEIFLEATLADQFEREEGSFYPKCRFCGRTNVEHNSGLELDCASQDYEKHLKLIANLKKKLTAHKEAQCL